MDQIANEIMDCDDVIIDIIKNVIYSDGLERSSNTSNLYSINEKSRTGLDGLNFSVSQEIPSSAIPNQCIPMQQRSGIRSVVENIKA